MGLLLRYDHEVELPNIPYQTEEMSGQLRITRYSEQEYIGYDFRRHPELWLKFRELYMSFSQHIW